MEEKETWTLMIMMRRLSFHLNCLSKILVLTEPVIGVQAGFVQAVLLQINQVMGLKPRLHAFPSEFLCTRNMKSF